MEFKKQKQNKTRKRQIKKQALNYWEWINGYQRGREGERDWNRWMGLQVYLSQWVMYTNVESLYPIPVTNI